MPNGKNGEIPKMNIVDTVRGNPWILATIFLAIVLVVMFFAGGATGNAVSESEAADNLVSFVEAQGGDVQTKVISIDREGSLYSVMLDYNGEEIPVYVTLDGNYLVSGLVPLSIEAADSGSASGSGSGATGAVQSETPQVELFVMSLCPYGTQLEKGIIPVVELLGDNIDFELKFVYYIMHDIQEIEENTRQYCIQKEQESKFLNYLGCYLGDGDADACLASTGIDTDKLDSCIESADRQFSIMENYDDKSTWLSGRFPLYDVHKTENSRYGVAGSPTLVINGAVVNSARDPASLLKTVCDSFTEDARPSACDKTLSSEAPSPGFGYEGSGSGSGSATCG